jgi:hypothetical protein
MDKVDSQELEPLFDDFFRPLQRGKHFEQYLVLEKHYIVSEKDVPASMSGS